MQATILADIKSRSLSVDWQKDGGKFIVPLPEFKVIDSTET